MGKIEQISLLSNFKILIFLKCPTFVGSILGQYFICPRVFFWPNHYKKPFFMFKRNYKEIYFVRSCLKNFTCYLFYFITYSFSQGCTTMSLKTKQKIKDHTSVCSCVRITKRFDRNQSSALLDENPRFIASRKSSLPAFLTTTTTVLYKEYM